MVDIKNTLGRVADPSFFLASTTAIVGAPPMTQLHRGMGGANTTAHTPLHHSYPHQPERLLAEGIAFRVLGPDDEPNFRTISDFRQDPFGDDEGTLRPGSEDRAGSGCVESGPGGAVRREDQSQCQPAQGDERTG